jgi:hypothetical protein
MSRQSQSRSSSRHPCWSSRLYSSIDISLSSRRPIDWIALASTVRFRSFTPKGIFLISFEVGLWSAKQWIRTCRRKWEPGNRKRASASHAGRQRGIAHPYVHHRGTIVDAVGKIEDWYQCCNRVLRGLKWVESVGRGSTHSNDVLPCRLNRPFEK